MAALEDSLRGEPDVGDVPKSNWGIKTMLRSIYDQPDADAVHAQFDRVAFTVVPIRSAPDLVQQPERLNRDIRRNDVVAIFLTAPPRSEWSEQSSPNNRLEKSAATSA